MIKIYLKVWYYNMKNEMYSNKFKNKNIPQMYQPKFTYVDKKEGSKLESKRFKKIITNEGRVIIVII
jgi:hypothetical protein